MIYDILIKNGTVIDGSGTPRYFADVGISHGKIVEINENLHDEAKEIITDLYEFLFDVAYQYDYCTVIENSKLKCNPLKQNKFRYLDRIDAINEKVGGLFGEKCDI